VRGRTLVAAAAVAATLLVALPDAVARLAPGAAAAEPGVTPEQLVLGGDGPASAPAARGLAAYLRWVNARGGVHGRRIVHRPTAEPAAVLALVGVSDDDAAADGVPHLLRDDGAVAKAASETSFGPTNAFVGRVFGSFLARAHPRSRVAVVTEGRDGGELLAGLRRGLRGSRVRVVGPQASADVVALFTSAALARETLGLLRGSPLVLLSPSAADVAEVPDGALSFGAAKEPADPRWAADPGLELASRIVRRQAPEAGEVHGLALGHALVQVLRAAGPGPTRARVAAAARALRGAGNPFLLPGVVVSTSREDGVAVEQGRLRRSSGGAWIGLGGLWGF
jgi:branched-chain amino acid transport system substrate-binding protein